LFQVRQAWTVHLFTASGVVVGMLALDAVLDGRPRAAIILLLITQLIDGIDGPMARAVDIQQRVPRIDGYVMDLVIDFVTCVVVPAIFMHQFGVLPNSVSLVIVGFVVFTSAMWFSRTDMMTDDHWFRGFPAVWNLVVASLYLTEAPRVMSAIICIGLATLSLTTVQVPHPVRAAWMRTPTLTVTIGWLAAMTWLTLTSDPQHGHPVLHGVMIGAPMYFLGLALVRMKTQRSSSGAAAALA
jgi:phosphatidylcholine synthase